MLGGVGGVGRDSGSASHLAPCSPNQNCLRWTEGGLGDHPGQRTWIWSVGQCEYQALSSERKDECISQTSPLRLQGRDRFSSSKASGSCASFHILKVLLNQHW